MIFCHHLPQVEIYSTRNAADPSDHTQTTSFTPSTRKATWEGQMNQQLKKVALTELLSMYRQMGQKATPQTTRRKP